MKMLTNVAYAQVWGCRFALHVGTIALCFGHNPNGRGPRLELLTPKHWFRWSGGYTIPEKQP